jgi:hypothetical protein
MRQEIRSRSERVSTIAGLFSIINMSSTVSNVRAPEGGEQGFDRDRNAPTNANQIRLQTSRIRQEHRPIRYQLPARLSFRQGQVRYKKVLDGLIKQEQESARASQGDRAA